MKLLLQVPENLPEAPLQTIQCLKKKMDLYEWASLFFPKLTITENSGPGLKTTSRTGTRKICANNFRDYATHRYDINSFLQKLALSCSSIPRIAASKAFGKISRQFPAGMSCL